MDLTLWLARFRRSDFMGIRRAPARGASSYLAGKVEGMRQFREARGKPCAAYLSILEQSEKEIREIQQLTGFDLYWRLYFALT